MDTLKNLGFKLMMSILAIIVVCLALYALIWKLAAMMFLLLLMAPFAIVIIWKIKQTTRHIKLAPSEKPNNPPYKV